ncbi:MAG TPA: hypothetical protein VE669_08275 [Actinomycetota bacterium]|jgi:transposase|nr:hypothetical protein [Actinomycetota bacterium]
MLFVLVGSFVLLLVVVYLIAAPATRPDPAEESGEASALLARKERLLSDIRELDMDLVTGKLDEQDHRRLRAASMVDAADALEALEAVERRDPLHAPPSTSDALADDALEAAIAARKRELEAWPHPERSEAGASGDGRGPGPRRGGEAEA